jgi:hypothetical protein
MGKKRLLRFHQYRKRTVTDVMGENNDESAFKKKLIDFSLLPCQNM